MSTLPVPLRLLCACIAAVGGAAAQALPPDWGARDLEARWVFASALAPGEAREPLLLALADRGDDRLLEWLAIYAPQRGTENTSPLALLVRQDSPHWPRTAAWLASGSVDSHQRDEADALILAHSGVFRAWYERHRPPTPAVDSPLMQQVRNAASALDVARYLPPIDPAPAVLAWLDAPPDLPRFGERTHAEPGVRYLHQVLRGIDGALQGRMFREPFLTKLARLAEHADPAVRQHALRALTALPADTVPFERVAALVDTGPTDVDRALATLAIGRSADPRAFARLVRILGQRTHPGWHAAVTRLGETAGPLGILALQRAHDEPGIDAEQAAAVRDAWTKARERLWSWQNGVPNDLDAQVVAWLERAAMLDADAADTEDTASRWGDAAADPVVRSTLDLPAVRTALERFLAGDGPGPRDPALAPAMRARAEQTLGR